MTAQPEMTPEDMAEVQARMQAEQQVFNQVIPLPLRYLVDSAQAQDGQPMITLFLETPAGSLKVAMDRDFALGMAANLKKQANTGPQLVTPPAGFVVPRA